MRYYKLVNGQQVFPSYRGEPEEILLYNGVWTSNPTPEMIAEMGWLPYTPPEVLPSPQEEPEWEDIIKAVKKMLSSDIESMSDEEALGVAALHPTWKERLESGKPAVQNERMWYNGKLWKVVQPHNMQNDWNPEDTPALYTEVSMNEWPEYVAPTGAHDAYNTGDKVTFEGQHYISLVNGNTFSPAEYPANWELQP